MDIKETNRKVIDQFRAGGEIDGMHRERLVLLTTVGRRTGQRRTTPMMFHRDGDRLIVIASNEGAPEHPAWYLDLVADPRITVEVGDETYDAVAAPTEGEERARLWPMIKEIYPFFADHDAKNDRTIPVVTLTRARPRRSCARNALTVFVPYVARRDTRRSVRVDSMPQSERGSTLGQRPKASAGRRNTR